MDKLEELVQRVSTLNKTTGSWPVEWQIVWVMEELGELSREIMKLSKVVGRFNSEKTGYNLENAAEELGDVFYGLISVGLNLEIDIRDAIETSVTKFENRDRNQLS